MAMPMAIVGVMIGLKTTTKAIHFMPDGYRNRGHPKRRWEDAMQEHFDEYWPNVHWWQSARDREWWAAEVEHFVRR